MNGYVLFGCAICTIGGMMIGFGVRSMAEPTTPKFTEYAISEIVEPALRHPDVGFDEYSAIDWLRSRIHFRQPDGTTIVGHNMLVSAVNQVNEMHAELLECRGPE